MQTLNFEQVEEVNGGILPYLIAGFVVMANAHLIDAFYDGVFDGAASAKAK